MEKLERKIGYTFRDKGLLRTALTHSSYANEKHSWGVCNERLEFLGDSVLGMTVADYLYRRFQDLPEGRMTRIRAELVCEQALVKVARELELGSYIYLGKGESATGGRERPSINADAVEALIAAVYLDGGLEEARKIIYRFILTPFEAEGGEENHDYKSMLQEEIQKKSGRTLRYKLVGESGPDHSKVFTVEVALNDGKACRGEGRTKKEAEQAAARALLEELGK